MNYQAASGRLEVLKRVLQNGKSIKNLLKAHCSSDSKVISIGNVTKKLREPKNPEFVPTSYLPKNPSQTWLSHLKWMLQKDQLGQDIFLIGSPGPLRRMVALSYLQMTQRELEFVALTRDTTETDLKQRREIKSGSSYYHDQSAVRAAINGHVLVLEGIEKAERNVLPVLNNLLENREMQLEDGRLLIAASRYDRLLETHSQEEMDKMKLVRVNPDFRVIALGLPSPPYQGHPLDPPLRSRFQAREISVPPFEEHFQSLLRDYPDVSRDVLLQCLSVAHTLLTKESKGLGLPDFPANNLYYIAALLDKFPDTPVQRVLQRLYPYQVFLPQEGISSVEEALKSFDVTSEGVLSGNSWGGGQPSHFVWTQYHSDLLSEIIKSHSIADFCIIGSKGCGKSAVISKFAQLLGYQTEPILLYQDMTARDLVQQRVTDINGDTSWQFSPLIIAAIEGKLALLDGIHRLHHGTLAVLHRLVHDRELQLFDGTRLLHHDRYKKIQEERALSDSEMTRRGIYKIHPAFRVAGLAEPPVIGATQGQWLNPEALSLFLYHTMRPANDEETLSLVKEIIGEEISAVQKLTSLSSHLCSSSDPALKSIGQSLSLRQIIRTARRFQAYPHFDIHTAIYKASLARFMPPLAKQALDTVLLESGIKTREDAASENLYCEVSEGVLKIGNTQAKIYSPDTQTKVPDTLFYDIQQHVAVLEHMLQDWLLGDHLLLVGNQGVGKNKLADRFLFLLNRPREYIQLHRDTTVQSLTIQPTVKDGRIVYEDSPLVTAVKSGYVLVIDEADKAPTNVTCVLKTLVESGEMLLSDTRRIVPQSHPLASQGHNGIIVSHPDFRMIVLANRPGFPFLGNDFFAALGDLFSCHAIDNPSVESEMQLLQSYGPDVSHEIMKKLVGAFSNLRDMADQGLIQYPYSTREVVNIVKHLQEFPQEGLSNVVRNVFDFDSWAPETKDTLIKVMHKHGIPLGVSPSDVNLAKKLPLDPPVIVGSWKVGKDAKFNISSLKFNYERSPLSYKGPLYVETEVLTIDPLETRATFFSEQQSSWQFPLYDSALISDIACATSLNNEVFVNVAAIAPIGLYIFNSSKLKQNLTTLFLHEIFPSMRGSYLPRLRIVPLPDLRIALHEESSNTLLFIDPSNGEVLKVNVASMIQATADSIRKSFGNRSERTHFRMALDGPDNGMIIVYEVGGGKINIVDFLIGHLYTFSLPIKITDIHVVSESNWLITSRDNSKWMTYSEEEQRCPTALYPLIESSCTEDNLTLQIRRITTENLPDFVLSSALQQKISSPSRFLAPSDDLAGIVVGYPELDSSGNEIWLWKRTGSQLPSPPSNLNPSKLSACLPQSGQVVRIVTEAPCEAFEGIPPDHVRAFLEVTDTVTHSLSYIPISNVPLPSPYWNWRMNATGSPILITSLGEDGVASVDASGNLRLWQTGSVGLERAMGDWRLMLARQEERLEIERRNEQEPNSPKHGKIDPTGAPHVGGNTWAGGTGGRDTAGLGGVGGPYRLDAGHDVYQVPQVEKDAVPESVRKAAREMAQKAFQQRLREIQMSEYDAAMYESISGVVNQQVKSLRNIISALQAKGKERQWLKHRSSGELDDTKLIEGLAGEKNIYRVRREEEPEIGAPQMKPKRLRLIVDVSGSMYRFNGYDGRLQREVEAALMVMEAFEGFETKFKYDIYGHSGETPSAPLVRADHVPKNNKERLDILKTLQAHAQFCLSGDNTLEAAEHAIKELSKEESDEAFVILLSDANLERYGIRPKQLTSVLLSNPEINTYAIFIGSLGDQASRLAKALPAGRAFVCLDLSKLPQILQQIFTSAVLH